MLKNCDQFLEYSQITNFKHSSTDICVEVRSFHIYLAKQNIRTFLADQGKSVAGTGSRERLGDNLAEGGAGTLRTRIIAT